MCLHVCKVIERALKLCMYCVALSGLADIRHYLLIFVALSTFP